MQYDEKSCGAVTYTVRDGQPVYLLVKNRSGHCGFPKGHVEAGENELQTAAREILEETGVKAAPDSGFRREYAYLLPDGKSKLGVYFVARYEGEIPQALDEIDRIWTLPYEEAMKVLNFEADRQILAEADVYILQNL